MSETTEHGHLWSEFDPQRYDAWEYFDNYRCECGAESKDGVIALPEPPQVPIYMLPNDLNVLQLNDVIDKTSAVMDALTETAEDTGVYVGHADLNHLESALSEFFYDRERRDEHSDAFWSGA